MKPVPPSDSMGPIKEALTTISSDKTKMQSWGTVTLHKSVYSARFRLRCNNEGNFKVNLTMAYLNNTFHVCPIRQALAWEI